MLSTVPEQMNLMARQVTLNHPNNMDCDIYRKSVLRTAGEVVGGLPELGGMAVLDSEDEPNVTWANLGEGKMLMVDTYQIAQMVNLDNAVDLANGQVFFMVEFTSLQTDPDARALQKHDIVMMLLTDDVRIGFEVMEVAGGVNIPPYTRRYVLEKRDELKFIGDLEAA